MRVVIVGGVERTERLLEDAARELGHSLEFHGGHVEGRGAGGLRAAIERTDLVIVVTDVNSHGAVHVARQAARKGNVPLLIMRRCSPSRLRAALLEATAPAAV